VGVASAQGGGCDGAVGGWSRAEPTRGGAKARRAVPQSWGQAAGDCDPRSMAGPQHAGVMRWGRRTPRALRRGRESGRRRRGGRTWPHRGLGAAPSP